MVFMNPYIDIALISIALAVISQLVYFRFVNTEEVKESRKAVKEKSKRIRELMKNRDEKSLQEVKRIQSEMMQDQMKAMKTMPYSFLTFPLYIIVFGYFGGSSIPVIGPLFGDGAYSGITFNLPVPIPWIDFQLHSSTNWLGYYAVWILLSTIIIKIGMFAFEKMKERKETVIADE